ncbi:hypothetical protein [Hymenobacter metallicola]|uniref:Uncharacterized protein n=1 Tax=Hymenobacter metallicola TaxID=2563114 RepID=A0A4Z0PZ43_9BACT|nr:hypothetical protein [Hymenobacter metallicola]TGE22705.1 hypothetical protein E5K02_23530 [Hymenobacter metallicola]
MEDFLLAGEELLNYTPNRVVLLTSYRIRYNAANASESRLVSIMLEKVSACEVRYQSQPALAITGILLILVGSIGFFQSGNGQMFGVVAAAVGFVLVLAYLASRQHIVSITSDGGARLGFATKGLKREAVIAFIDSVEKAKHERVERLHQMNGGVLV